jgi:hypothetical protein
MGESTTRGHQLTLPTRANTVTITLCFRAASPR